MVQLKSKSIDFWFLLRFVIITVIYSIECFLLKTNLMILDPRFFPFILFVYSVAIIISFLFNNTTRTKIKLISDIIFLILFIMTILISIIISNQGLGDFILPGVILLLLLPMLICFFVWLIRDMNKWKKMTEQGLDKDIAENQQ